MTMNTTAPTPSRIPLGLQAVFLSSNRGMAVTKPPPEKAASKTFSGSWMFQGLKTRTRRSKGSKNRKERKDRQEKVAAKSDGFMSDASHTSLGSMAYLTDDDSVARIKSKPIKTIVQEAAPKPKATGRPPMSPQAYLDVMIHSRGYSTRRYRTLQTGYYSKPTDFQQASYHVNLVKIVRDHRVEDFQEILSSGVSPNPCNSYGESLLHMVCRRGDSDLLQIMLDAGSSVQVADDYGRTPLHDACWAATPSFDTVEKIANLDITLFHMTDSRGAVPLSYVRREHWSEWLEFLESKKGIWWPPVSGMDQPSPLLDVAPNECSMKNPENALTVELAGMVASGKMTSEEARLFMEDDDTLADDESESDSDVESEDADAEEDSDDESSEDESSEYDSDDDDSSSLGDEDECEELGMTMADMKEIMKRVNYAKAR